MSPDTATHIDGAKLVTWLEDLYLMDDNRAHALGERWERAVHAWKTEGRIASVYTVDEFLTSIGLTLGMLPDDFYREDPRKGKPTHPQIAAGIPDRIRALRDLGWTSREAGLIVGVSHTTVLRHSKAAA